MQVFTAASDTRPCDSCFLATEDGRFTLQGKLSVEIASALRDQLLEFSAGLGDEISVVTVDCEELASLDGACLQVLLAWDKYLAAQGMRLDLVNIPPHLREAMVGAGVHQLPS